MSPAGPRAGVARPTAVVLAGGLGTRMSALSADHPKHLLEVAGEPVIVHQLRWLADHGVVDVVLATSHLADRFEPVLGDGRRWGVRLRYSTEPTPEGTGGGLRRAARLLDPLPERLVVVNGDLLTGHDLTRQLALAVARPDAEAVLHVRTVPDARPFGCVVAGPRGRVTAFLEKSPDPPGHEVNGGTYVLSRSAVASIPDGTSSLEVDVLPRLVSRGSVLAYREDALWEDVGTPVALVRASRALVLRSGRDAHLDPTARVHPSAEVSGGSAVGPGAVIGAGAQVLGSVVMSAAVVEAGARVEDRAVAPGSTVRSGRATGEEESRS